MASLGREMAVSDGRSKGRRTNKRGPLSREEVRAEQRARIMRATAQVVAERGFGGASIARVVETAGVSRATFYDLFENFEQCFLAVLDTAMRRACSRAWPASAYSTSTDDRDTPTPGR